MINPFADVNWKPDRKALLRFARSLMIGFPVVAAIWLLVGRLGTGHWQLARSAGLAGGGLAVGMLFLAIPAISKPFYLFWYAVACSIGLVISNVLLAAAYYVVLTPIGVLRRLAGQRSIERAPDASAPTYWKPSPARSDPTRYLRQF